MSLLLTTAHTASCKPFADIYLEAITRAIVSAWEMVCDSGFDSFEDEDETTAAIEDALCAILEEREGAPRIPLFTDRYFETPARDGKHREHSGVQHDKMPDLTFRLAGDGGRPRPYRAVFVECKVLDKTRSLNLYCKNGVQRFVDGQYSFKMPHAMMLGYVLHDSAFSDALDNFFKDSRSACAKRCAPVSSCYPSYTAPKGYAVYVTIHERKFEQAPGNIDLHHLWLRTPCETV